MGVIEGAAGGGGGAAGSVVAGSDPGWMITLPKESKFNIGLSATAGVAGSNIKGLANNIAAIVSMIIFKFILSLLINAIS